MNTRYIADTMIRLLEEFGIEILERDSLLKKLTGLLDSYVQQNVISLTLYDHKDCPDQKTDPLIHFNYFLALLNEPKHKRALVRSEIEGIFEFLVEVLVHLTDKKIINNPDFQRSKFANEVTALRLCAQTISLAFKMHNVISYDFVRPHSRFLVSYNRHCDSSMVIGPKGWSEGEMSLLWILGTVSNLAPHREPYTKRETFATRKPFGFSEAQFAATYNHTQLLQQAVDNKDKLNTDKGSSALSIACKYGHVECVEILVKDHSVNVNEPFSNDYSPLACALFGAAEKEDKLTMINMLCDRGAEFSDNEYSQRDCLRSKASEIQCNRILEMINKYEEQFQQPRKRPKLLPAELALKMKLY